MTIEPSDIVKLLDELGREDATCRALHSDAQRGANILTVCHEAIRLLAKDKGVLNQRLVEAISLLPPPSQLRGSE